MKITGEQRNAASLYWTQLLTGEINPQALIDSKKGLPPFMAVMEATNRSNYLKGLEQQNPRWALDFMHRLDELLVDADSNLYLRLEYQPEGLLKQAANLAGISEGLFPTGKLSMTFDHQGNMIVGGETIDADSFIRNAAAKMASDYTS